jgi:DNA repair protein RadC
VEQRNGIGGIAQVYVDVRSIFKKALLNNATGIIIGHNHPSGNVKPSEEDKNLTKRIKAICGIMDINLLDHIIIGMNNYFSFAEEGIL